MAWHDPHQGTVYYWNPVNGLDTDDGLAPVTTGGGTGPKLTWAGGSGIEDTWQAGDTCYVAMPGRTTQYTYTSQVSMATPHTTLIGPPNSHMLKIHPTAANALSINAIGVKVANLTCEVDSGTRRALYINTTGDYVHCYGIVAIGNNNAACRNQGADDILCEKCIAWGNAQSASGFLNLGVNARFIDCIAIDCTTAFSNTGDGAIYERCTARDSDSARSSTATVTYVDFQGGRCDSEWGTQPAEYASGGAGELTNKQRSQLGGYRG